VKKTMPAMEIPLAHGCSRTVASRLAPEKHKCLTSP
jgi:hypothetical protein